MFNNDKIHELGKNKHIFSVWTKVDNPATIHDLHSTGTARTLPYRPENGIWLYSDLCNLYATYTTILILLVVWIGFSQSKTTCVWSRKQTHLCVFNNKTLLPMNCALVLWFVASDNLLLLDDDGRGNHVCLPNVRTGHMSWPYNKWSRIANARSFVNCADSKLLHTTNNLVRPWGYYVVSSGKPTTVFLNKKTKQPCVGGRLLTYRALSDLPVAHPYWYGIYGQKNQITATWLLGLRPYKHLVKHNPPLLKKCNCGLLYVKYHYTDYQFPKTNHTGWRSKTNHRTRRTNPPAGLHKLRVGYSKNKKTNTQHRKTNPYGVLGGSNFHQRGIRDWLIGAVQQSERVYNTLERGVIARTGWCLGKVPHFAKSKQLTKPTASDRVSWPAGSGAIAEPPLGAFVVSSAYRNHALVAFSNATPLVGNTDTDSAGLCYPPKTQNCLLGGYVRNSNVLKSYRWREEQHKPMSKKGVVSRTADQRTETSRHALRHKRAKRWRADRARSTQTLVTGTRVIHFGSKIQKCKMAHDNIYWWKIAEEVRCVWARAAKAGWVKGDVMDTSLWWDTSKSFIQSPPPNAVMLSSKRNLSLLKSGGGLGGHDNWLPYFESAHSELFVKDFLCICAPSDDDKDARRFLLLYRFGDESTRSLAKCAQYDLALKNIKTLTYLYIVAQTRALDYKARNTASSDALVYELLGTVFFKKHNISLAGVKNYVPLLNNPLCVMLAHSQGASVVGVTKKYIIPKLRPYWDCGTWLFPRTERRLGITTPSRLRGDFYNGLGNVRRDRHYTRSSKGKRRHAYRPRSNSDGLIPNKYLEWIMGDSDINWGLALRVYRLSVDHPGLPNMLPKQQTVMDLLKTKLALLEPDPVDLAIKKQGVYWWGRGVGGCRDLGAKKGMLRRAYLAARKAVYMSVGSEWCDDGRVTGVWANKDLVAFRKAHHKPRARLKTPRTGPHTQLFKAAELVKGPPWFSTATALRYNHSVLSKALRQPRPQGPHNWPDSLEYGLHDGGNMRIWIILNSRIYMPTTQQKSTGMWLVEGPHFDQQMSLVTKLKYTYFTSTQKLRYTCVGGTPAQRINLYKKQNKPCYVGGGNVGRIMGYLVGAPQRHQLWEYKNVNYATRTYVGAPNDTHGRQYGKPTIRRLTLGLRRCSGWQHPTTYRKSVSGGEVFALTNREAYFHHFKKHNVANLLKQKPKKLRTYGSINYIEGTAPDKSAERVTLSDPLGYYLTRNWWHASRGSGMHRVERRKRFGENYYHVW